MSDRETYDGEPAHAAAPPKPAPDEQQQDDAGRTERFGWLGTDPVVPFDPCDGDAPPLLEYAPNDLMPFVDPDRIDAARQLAVVVALGDGLQVFRAAAELRQRWTRGGFRLGDEQFSDTLYCAYRRQNDEITAAEWAVLKAGVFGLADPALPPGTPRNTAFGEAFDALVTALAAYDRVRPGDHDHGHGHGGGWGRSPRAARIAANEAARAVRLDLQQTVGDFAVRLVGELRHRLDNDLRLLLGTSLTSRVSAVRDLWPVVDELVPGGVPSSAFGRQISLVEAEEDVFGWLRFEPGGHDPYEDDAFDAAVDAALVIDALQAHAGAPARPALNGGGAAPRDAVDDRARDTVLELRQRSRTGVATG